MQKKIFFLFGLAFSWSFFLESSASKNPINKQNTCRPLPVSIESSLKKREQTVYTQKDIWEHEKQQTFRCCKEDGTPCDTFKQGRSPSKIEAYRTQKEEVESIKGGTAMRKQSI